MSIQIKIDKKRAVPAFRQIVEKIAALIGEGSLKSGHKLPTERELAESLGLARGTVTRAYVELEQTGLITRLQGRGSTVSGLPEAAGQGRKEKAAALISALVEKLDRLRFSLPEMKMLIDLAIREREEKLSSLNIAAVDCNPETLGSFERQIGMLSHVSVRTYLLDELARDPDPARRLGEFDLVLTTTTHHPQLVAMAPRLSERILAVAVSPSRETVMQLATVKPVQPIGVLCESRQFLAIIGGRLKEMRIAGPLDALFSPRPQGMLAEFLRDRSLLIVPPAGRASPSREEARALEEFTGRGGLVVVFDYQIDKGSLVHVEERIGSILKARADAANGARA